uniref:Uncharacterized protein n=1 Tax=Steinernema glaseri TaxID=37863 RepID=A0A1I7ZPS3_9BILA
MSGYANQVLNAVIGERDPSDYGLKNIPTVCSRGRARASKAFHGERLRADPDRPLETTTAAGVDRIAARTSERFLVRLRYPRKHLTEFTRRPRRLMELLFSGGKPFGDERPGRKGNPSCNETRNKDVRSSNLQRAMQGVDSIRSHGQHTKDREALLWSVLSEFKISPLHVPLPRSACCKDKINLLSKLLHLNGYEIRRAPSFVFYGLPLHGHFVFRNAETIKLTAKVLPLGAASPLMEFQRDLLYPRAGNAPE